VTLFGDASAHTLRALATALRSGHLSVPLLSFALGRQAPNLSEAAAHALRTLSEDGIAPRHLALVLEQAAEALDAKRESARDVEFVWTGLEGDHAHARDTAVVVAQLFAQADRSVLVSSYAVYQGADVFAPLAARMAERPDLRVRLFLHVARGPGDTRDESELLRAFAAGFAKQWPWAHRPEVWYDPRTCALDAARRAAWHAKCVVVDDRQALVTSANFTEWAQQRNVEAGVLVRSAAFAVQLRQQFDALVQSRQVRRLPGY
jgi:phosphatidylserine/phosphatidylglycerophosphate/cardiolipin synthase-like enzyme